MTNTHSKPTSESEFVGMYTGSDVDSRTQLFLLDDNTFCFTFMGGALDLVKAGRWTLAKKKGTITLKESRIETPIYPVYVKNLDRLGPAVVGINFDGYTLSNANSPVFAVTNTDAQPTTFKPIFPDGNSTWSMTYTLPLMLAKEAKYLFIGDMELDANGGPKRLRMVQYKIGDFDTVRIGFNELQSDPAMNVDAQLINNVLQLGGNSLGSREPLTDDTIAEVRKHCINPILQPDKVSTTQNTNQEQSSDKGKFLTPIRSFYLDKSATVGKPIFIIGDENALPATDSLDDLIKSENKLLQVAFDSASGDIETLDDYLKLAKSITEKKQRIKNHLPLIVNQYAKLIVAITMKGKFKVSETVFFDYLENIHPATVNVKDDAMSYSISVIASQGLIITTALKKAEISKLVFDTLLGDKYDIKTHKNDTLIYNLACFYAINNRKTAMLEAIKQARKRGKPTKQFMSDTDFKNYWSDTEFINAIK